MPKAIMDEPTLAIIAKYGKDYKSSMLPPDVKRGRPGNCFDTCIANVFFGRKYTYVEGMATDPVDPTNLVLHAWLTDGKHAFDPTWQAVDVKNRERPIPSGYFGIEIPIDKALAYMKITGMQGILANRGLAPVDYERIFAGILL